MLAAACCAICFGCLVAMGIIYGVPPSLALVILVLSSVAIGTISLFAFALRGAIEEKWRFSLAGLLIVTTLVAVALGALVAAGRF